MLWLLLLFYSILLSIIHNSVSFGNTTIATANTIITILIIRNNNNLIKFVNNNKQISLDKPIANIITNTTDRNALRTEIWFLEEGVYID